MEIYQEKIQQTSQNTKLTIIPVVWCSFMLRIYGCMFCSISLLSVYMSVRMPSGSSFIAGVPSSRALPGFYITVQLCAAKQKKKVWAEIFHHPSCIFLFPRTEVSRRYAFCKFQDNLEISFMDTNGDLEIICHVGHLRRTPELSQENGLRKVFLMIVKFH